MTKTLARVLVVEDNPVLADVLRFNLQRAKLDVTVALDGATALDYLRSASVDLMITDYQMPGLNGAELCSLVRQEPKLARLPIIMCSAKGCELDLRMLKESFGVAQVIHKPFSMRQIVDLVRTLIEDASGGLVCELASCFPQAVPILQPGV